MNTSLIDSTVASSRGRESRRGSSRREVMLPCQVVREHDFRLIADRTLDISAEGMLLPLRRPVLEGEALIVSFSIPGIWIDVEATVARVVHGRRPGDDGLAVGISFDRIASSARAALAGFLHGRRPPLPRRGPLGRVRRGEGAPQLADDPTRLLGGRLLYPDAAPDVALADVADVMDDDDEVPDTSPSPVDLERPTATGRRPEVDGLGVLRAVVGAWQNLLVENGASNVE